MTKVRIKNNVSTYTSSGKMYKPGDIVEIDVADFCDWFMEKIEEPQPKLVIQEEKPQEPLPHVKTERKAETSDSTFVEEPELTS